MYRRSRAREVAVQLMFQYDRNPGVERPAIEQFARDRLRHTDLVEYCLRLYDGTRSMLPEIDAALQSAAQNWALQRMAVADRNVLRVGTYEILVADPAVPPIVAVTEAVDLARRYGSADSSAFVNGVLDRVRLTAESRKPAAAPTNQPQPPDTSSTD